MSNEILTEIKCPNCLNPIDVREHSRHVVCDSCSSQFILQGHLCPSCHTYHAELQGVCRDCGTPLTRICQKCHHKNWAGDEFCAACSTPMDLFDLMINNQNEARDQVQNARLAQIRDVRESSAAASQERMSRMVAVEEARLQRLKESEAQRKRNEMLLFSAIGVIIFFVLCGLIWLLLA